jgi:hypothetical protein
VRIPVLDSARRHGITDDEMVFHAMMLRLSTLAELDTETAATLLPEVNGGELRQQLHPADKCGYRKTSPTELTTWPNTGMSRHRK